MLNYRNEKKVNKTITVFYHLFIPDTNNMWIWWVDEQMSLLRDVGLADKATINMCITLPLGLYNSKTGHSYDEMVIGYIKDRYPFVNIIDMRGVGEQPNLYEMQTLLKLHDFSKNNNSHVLYFHNKGIGSYLKNEYPPGTIHDWRKYLQYFLIENHEQCLKKLDEGYDYVSVDEIEWNYKFGFADQPKYKHLMGNFWWSNTNYIRNLGSPTNFLDNYEKAINNKINFNSQEDFNEFYRLSSELWIHLNRPKCFHIHNSNINNYFEYYPKEKYLEN
jgi:hypothetical protein